MIPASIIVILVGSILFITARDTELDEVSDSDFLLTWRRRIPAMVMEVVVAS